MAPVQGAKPRAAPSTSGPVAPKPAPPAAPPPAPPASKKPGDTGYRDAEKQKVKLTGTHPSVKKEKLMSTAEPPAPAAMIPPMPVALDAAGKAAVAAMKSSTMPNKAQDLNFQFQSLDQFQQRAVWEALPKALRATIEKEMSAKGATQYPQIWMAKAASLNNSELATELKKMRTTGGGKHGPFEVALAAERAARTKWGNAHPHIIQHLKAEIGAGRVSFGDGRGAMRTTAKGIGIDNAQANSPEAMAANLAHEAQHSYNIKAHGHLDPSVYAEETSGNVVSAQVWAEVGDPKDKGVSPNGLETLNEMADAWKAGGEDAVQARMAVEYAGEAAQKGELGKVDDILTGLGGDPGAQKHLTALDASVLIKASTTGKELPAERLTMLGKAFKNAPAEVRAEAEKHFKGAELAALQAAWK